MKVIVNPVVIGALGTVPGGLVKGVEDLAIIQTTALLRSTKILSRVLETWRDLLPLRLRWKTISYCWYENLARSNKNDNSNPLSSSKVMYSYGPFHIAEQKQGNQLEPTYCSSVRFRSVVLRTCRKRWTIGKGGQRESGISVLMVRQDDDDEPFVNNFCFNYS